MQFIDKIKAKAKANQQIVVLPESYDERMLYAAEKIVEQGLAKLPAPLRNSIPMWKLSWNCARRRG